MADILSSRNKTKKTGAQNRERNPEKILFRLRARVLPNKHQKGNVVDPRKKQNLEQHRDLIISAVLEEHLGSIPFVDGLLKVQTFNEMVQAE